MMIGGDDIIISTSLKPELALDASVRVLLCRWPDALFQDAIIGQLYPDYGSLAFRGLSELLVYRDRDAFDSWELLGAEGENVKTMIYFLARPGELTLVVDDRASPDAKSLIGAVGDVLRNMHTPGQLKMRAA